MMFDFGDEDSENFLFDQPLSVNNGIFLLNHVINKAVMGGNFGEFGEVRIFVLVASFVLLYQRDRFKNFVSNLRYYGTCQITCVGHFGYDVIIDFQF